MIGSLTQLFRKLCTSLQNLETSMETERWTSSQLKEARDTSLSTLTTQLLRTIPKYTVLMVCAALTRLRWYKTSTGMTGMNWCSQVPVEGFMRLTRPHQLRLLERGQICSSTANTSLEPQNMSSCLHHRDPC